MQELFAEAALLLQPSQLLARKVRAKCLLARLEHEAARGELDLLQAAKQDVAEVRLDAMHHYVSLRMCLCSLVLSAILRCLFPTSVFQSSDMCHCVTANLAAALSGIAMALDFVETYQGVQTQQAMCV